MLYEVDDRGETTNSQFLYLAGTPDEVIPMDAQTGDGPHTVDFIGGLMVVRAMPGEHYRKPATTFFLEGSLTNREVGRFTVTNDLTQDEPLRWDRYFEDVEQMVGFHHKFNNQELAPAGFKQVKARQLAVGDVYWEPEIGISPPITELNVFPLSATVWKDQTDDFPSGVVVDYKADGGDFGTGGAWDAEDLIWQSQEPALNFAKAFKDGAKYAEKSWAK